MHKQGRIDAICCSSLMVLQYWWPPGATKNGIYFNNDQIELLGKGKKIGAKNGQKWNLRIPEMAFSLCHVDCQFWKHNHFPNLWAGHGMIFNLTVMITWNWGKENVLFLFIHQKSVLLISDYWDVAPRANQASFAWAENPVSHRYS